MREVSTKRSEFTLLDMVSFYQTFAVLLEGTCFAQWYGALEGPLFDAQDGLRDIVFERAYFIIRKEKMDRFFRMSEKK